MAYSTVLRTDCCVVPCFRPDNVHTRVDCRINCPDPAVPARVNPRLLVRAVLNLLQNAVRHASQRIHVTLETADCHCLIHVDDDGTGVAAANLRRILEPFVRLEHSEMAESQGYGLGLAIAQRIAKWHGGLATVENAAIGGVRFTIRWPNKVKSTTSSASDQKE